MLNHSEQEGTPLEDESISLSFNFASGVYLSMDFVFEILSFLPTSTLSKMALLNRQWYQFITIESVVRKSNVGFNIWDNLMKKELGIAYFPFQSKAFTDMGCDNARSVCQIIVKYQEVLKEVTKGEFLPHTEDQSNLFIRIHLNGEGRTGKSSIADVICKGVYPDRYTATESFKLLIRSYKLGDRYIKASIFDNAGKEELQPRRSIFSMNLFVGKCSILYVFNEEEQTLEAVSKWKSENERSRKGLRVVSNSNIGARDNSVKEENQLPPLEFMVFNRFHQKDESLCHTLLHSPFIEQAIIKAESLGLPLLVCDVHDMESVKNMLFITNCLLLHAYGL